MKKRNFKFYLTMLTLVFGAFLLSACGGKGTLTFNQAELVMGMNEELELKDLVTLKDTTINDITFESSDSNIVVISPRQTIIAGQTEGSAIITAKGFSGCIEITVKGEKEKFSAPTNIHYNSESSCIEWDNVYSGNVVANNFRVNITKGEEEPQSFVVNKNYYELSDYGDFKVTITCLSRNGIKESDESGEYKFTKLSEPFDIQYNANTNTLSWQAGEDAQAFYIKKDGVLSQKLVYKTYELELTEEKEYKISILTTTLNNGNDVFGSESKELTLTRLASPQITINQGVMSWTDSQKGVDHYEVSIYNSQGVVNTANIPYNGTTYTFKLSGQASGTYNVKVQAIGDSTNGLFSVDQHYLNSAVSESGDILKLEKPTLLFDKANKKISLLDFNLTNAYKYAVTVNYNGQFLEELDISATGECVYDFAKAGTYTLTASNKATNNKQLNSETSEEIVVTKLAILDNIRQSVDNSGNYVLTNLSLSGATKFVVEKEYQGAKQTLTLANGNYGQANEIFANQGNYKIIITASGDDSANHYVLDSTTTLNVERLSNPTLTDDGRKIVWDKVSNISGIIYSYEINDDETLKGSTTNTYYDYNNLPAGLYTIKVTSKSGVASGEGTLILDAFSFASINFEITKTIASSQLSVVRSETGYNLNITPVQNANKYLVKINGEIFKNVNYVNEEVVVVALEDFFANKGKGTNGLVYTIEVQASNTENDHYLPSEFSTVDVEKITVPTTFNVSETEVVSVTKNQKYITDFEIYINDEKTNVLNVAVKDFTVKVKYISDVQKHDNKYYLDSDFANFTLKRIPLNIEFYGSIAKWAITETEQSYTAKLNFVQSGSTVFSTPIDQIPLFDIASIDLTRLGLDLSVGFTGNVTCDFGNITGSIAGEYLDGKFVSGTDGELTNYYINNKSNSITLKFADAELNFNAVEDAGNVKLSWTQKQDCAYTLFDSKINHEAAEGEVIVDSGVYKDVKNYLITLNEKLQDEQTVYVAYINRLAPIANLTINEDETISVAEQTGAEKAVITKGEQGIENLQDITTSTEVVKAKYVAKTNVNSYTFYLNSEEKTYSFARLTKLNTTTNLNIYNNIISWTKEDSANYEYLVKFYDDSASEAKFVTLSNAEINSIDLTKQEYQQIIKSLTGKKYIAIQKNAGSFIAKTDNVNYLSSVYCDSVLLKIIVAPTNVKIEATNDLTQDELKITWEQNTEGVEIAKYVIAITHNGQTQEIESNGSLIIDSASDLFKAEGEWKVKVKALGSNDTIMSDYSEEVSIVRLKQSASLALAKTGEITWGQVEKVKEYKLIYEYTNASGEKVTNSVICDNVTTLSDIFVECLKDTFSGDINLTLYAIGDKTTTLTSIKTATFTRLTTPTINVQNDRIAITNYDIYPQGTEIYVVAKIDGNVVINSNVTIEKDNANNNVWYLPTEFKYVNEQGQTVVVDLSTQKVCEINITAKNQNAKYLDSNITSCNVTALSPITNLRFYRDNQGVIHFKADNPNTNVTTVELRVGLITKTFNGNIDFALDNEALKIFGSAWQLDVQAMGENKDSVDYINSKITTIKGTKLNTVALNSVGTRDGAVVWQAINGATDYRLCIDENVYKEGYKQDRREALRDSSFASGEHILTIKALGNILSEEVTTNIVLDSDYSLTYTVTKLPELSDLAVKNGYFTFTEIPKASDYVMAVYADLSGDIIAEYSMGKVEDFPAQEQFTYYHNKLLLEKLKTNPKLYIRVYNKTLEDNYVYSNFALTEFGGVKDDYILVTRLENANDVVSLYHPLKPDAIQTDYLTTIAKWNTNENANNGYVLNIDGELQTLTESNYTLDKDSDWITGEHKIKYKQLGSSGMTTGRLAYLTADFSNELVVTKLKPVTINISLLPAGTQELCLTYNTVAGADKYYAFLDDVYFKEYSNSSDNIALQMEELESGKVYETFGMRAVNTLDVTYLASYINYVTVLDSEGSEYPVAKKLKVSKLTAPQQPTFKDGAFYWELSDNDWQKILLDGIQGEGNTMINTPFEICFSNLDTQKFVVNFISKKTPVITYSYVQTVCNFLYMSDEQKARLSSRIDTLGSLAGLDEAALTYAKKRLNDLQESLKGGFASLRFGFNKFASDLPTGEYEIKISLVGKDIIRNGSGVESTLTAKFSSDFISLGTKYVAPAPNITAVAKDGKYTLEFNNVNVNETYFTSGPRYSLIGIYYDETFQKNMEKEIAVISSDAVNNSQNLIFNLTELIEAKKLDSTFTQIYVVLKGDDGKVLNGKPSNVINISILDEVEAKVVHGIINWHAQQYAADYQIAYSETDSSIKSYKNVPSDEEIVWYNWDSSELTEAKAYNVTLQARGWLNGRINTSEVFRMSGKVTSIGTVTKLPNISNIKNGVDIQNGVFVWNAVENASAYDVYYTKTEGQNYTISLSYNAFYESEVKDLDPYYYYFMAIGTEEEILKEDSAIYVNSKLSEYNLAQRVKTIEEITFSDGVIQFTPSQGYRTNYYRLTFYKIDTNGERSDKLCVYTTDTTYDTNRNESLLAFGKYEVDIQACYETKDKAVHPTNTNIYQIISYANKEDNIASTSYYKFDQVVDLQVKQGRISWTFNNDGQIPAKDYAFKLEFTTPNKDVVVKYVSSDRTYYEDVVYDDILTTDNITLNLYVCASEEAEGNYVKSVSTKYLNIHQYEKVDENQIEISTTADSQLKVDWSKGVKGTSTEGFKYEISFSANNLSEKFFTNVPYFVTGEGNDISFNIDGDYTLVLRIRVIPMVDNYISSVWTNNKEIARPRSVSGLTYNEESCIFTWDKYEGTENWSSYSYKIKDEVTYINSNGDMVTEVYIFTAKIGDESFAPFASGKHNVSVAVMVSNSGSDNFISEYASINDIEFNLYAGGNGTEQKPYLISTIEHFKNMKYRMNKDAKNNNYFFGTIVDGVTTLDKEMTIATSTQYCFKQTANLVVEKNGEIDETLNTQDFAEFDGIYDGDYYSITLNYTHIDGTTDFANVSLFNTISENSVVKDIKLYFNLTSTDKDKIFYGNGGAVAKINLLCQENNGTITNIVVGDIKQTIEINSRDLVLYMSFIAYTNNGIISNVQNNYNVSITDSYKRNQRDIQFATIAIDNQNRVEYVKNNGSIDVTGTTIIVGGVVAHNKNGAKITAAANAGNITVYYNNRTSTSLIGGLVAKNDRGELTYCYSTGTFTINGGVSTLDAKVGGLVAWSVNDKISNSYVNVTMTTTITNFNMYQVVGLLESSQNQASNVYYKKLNNLAGVNGTASSGFKTYTNSPTDDTVNLYSGDSLFNKSDVDANGNPRLKYEAAFENLTWKD
ncbi:MAG: hypothetical protein MR904_02065 [Clostridia bacterium]|nr:hypothetical protein [Clostridia bacterium]